MGLWIFQWAMDAMLAGVLIALFQQRRKLKVLMAQVEDLQRNAHTSALQNSEELVAQSVAPQTEVTQTVPLKETLPGFQLSERKVAGKRTQGPVLGPDTASYDKAEELLGRGLALREVSLKTGLSMSELQLFEKIAQKNQ